jgi:hypothetical protein
MNERLKTMLTNVTPDVSNLSDVGSSARCFSFSSRRRCLRFLYHSCGLEMEGRLSFFDVNRCLKDFNVDRLKLYLAKRFLRFVINRGTKHGRRPSVV